MKTYTGGCHCGNVRYEVDLDLTSAMECNCSMCSKAGWLLTFAPAEHFRLTSGDGKLTDYQFNKNSVHHFFCPICGIKSFSQGVNSKGEPTYAINVRCLDGVDLSTLTITKVNGKDF